MGERAHRLTAKEVEAILLKFGFQQVSQKGSHRKWRHPVQGLQVVVPMHANRTLPLGTMLSILKGAEIPESEYRG
jgi:predicted RNA binding protein YcfA (HicA-like mRNA interferase family)